jgi:general secretion pathway protein G
LGESQGLKIWCCKPVLSHAAIYRHYVQECSTGPFFLWTMRDMHRAFAAVLIFTMVCSIVACAHREQLRKEASLQESLGLLRREIKQFTLDHERSPASLSELLSGGYFNRIPTDPFTGRNDTWRTQTSQAGKYLEVRSGSDAISSNGTRYSAW